MRHSQNNENVRRKMRRAQLSTAWSSKSGRTTRRQARSGEINWTEAHDSLTNYNVSPLNREELSGRKWAALGTSWAISLQMQSDSRPGLGNNCCRCQPLTKVAWLEQDFWAAETFDADSDNVIIKNLVDLSSHVRTLSYGLQLGIKVERNVAQLHLDIALNLACRGGVERVPPISEDLDQKNSVRSRSAKSNRRMV